jgi:hypothetical protein
VLVLNEAPQELRSDFTRTFSVTISQCHAYKMMKTLLVTCLLLGLAGFPCNSASAQWTVSNVERHEDPGNDVWELDDVRSGLSQGLSSSTAEISATSAISQGATSSTYARGNRKYKRTYTPPQLMPPPHSLQVTVNVKAVATASGTGTGGGSNTTAEGEATANTSAFTGATDSRVASVEVTGMTSDAKSDPENIMQHPGVSVQGTLTSETTLNVHLTVETEADANLGAFCDCMGGARGAFIH